MIITEAKLTNGEMPRSTPEAEGIPSAAVLRFLDEVQRESLQLHAFEIARHGRIIASAAAAPYTMDSFHRICSAAKGVVASAILIAVGEGRFELDTPTVKLLDPAHIPESLDERWQRLTVYHLLTMHTGHAEDTFFEMFGGRSDHWIRTFFEIAPQYEPGTFFCYDMGAQYVMNEIIRHTTGEELGAYLKPRLFDPMGIEAQYDFTQPEGLFFSSHIQFRPTALTKLSQLYLQGGSWDGRQLIRRDLAELAAQQHSPCEYTDTDFGVQDPDDNAGYALHMWRNSVGGFRFCGGQGQFGVILPEYDMVLSTFGGEDRLNRILEAFWRTVLRSCHYRSLPEDSAAHSRLQRRLAALSTVQEPLSDMSTAAALVSGRRYAFDKNSEGQREVTLRFEEGHVMIDTLSEKGARSFACGLAGRWEENRGYFMLAQPDGEVQDIDRILFYDPNETLLTGGWRDGATFVVAMRSRAMMCGYAFAFEFFTGGLEVTLTTTAHSPHFTHMGQAAKNSAVILTAREISAQKQEL